MSSTRYAQNDSPLRQERFASSEEYDKALKAGPVSKRCALLPDRKDRELLWWLQYQSQQETGLDSIAAKVVELNPSCLATPAMQRIGLRASHHYTREQVLEVRREIMKGDSQMPESNNLPYHMRHIFEGRILPLSGDVDEADYYAHEEEGKPLPDYGHPKFYTAEELQNYCRRAARRQLPHYLTHACINPKVFLSNSTPWFFSGLRSALLDLMESEATEQRSKLVVTAIGKKVHRCLDMALKTRSLIVVNGVARIGKSFSARTWCYQHAGIARFVEVPPSNDDIGFFRAIARGLGLGNFLNYKAAEIRERIEAVLITGQLLLVLDEAHRCWPQRNPRYGFPSRIEWIMSMVNKNVPICALVTPQFFANQQRSESTGWASEQLTGRITHHEQLPCDLAAADLESVARTVLPEAGNAEVGALVAYARSSVKYLAAIDSIVKTSRYMAEEDGRTTVRRSDIQRAINEGVMQSDSSLAKAIQSTAPKRRKPSLALTAPPIQAADPDAAAEQQQPSSASAARGQLKISSGSPTRAMRPAADLAEV